MKKILWMVLFLCLSGGAFAQERIIEQAEFDQIHKSSFQHWAGKSRREISSVHSFSEAAPKTNVAVNSSSAVPQTTTFYKSTVEFLATGEFHSKTEFGAAGSGISSAVTKIERISISGKIYTRRGDGAWTEVIPTVRPPKPEKSPTKSTDVQIVYKFLGSETFDGQTADVYAKLQTSKLINLKNNAENHFKIIEKHWYDQDGRLLKVEARTEIRNETTVSKIERTWLYQFDPNIKIEAPVLN